MPPNPDLSEKLKLLAAFPQLAKISDPGWNEVVRKAQPITIPSGTIVIHKDTACQNFLLLSEGSMRVRQISESGREIVLYRVGPGDISILALTSLVDGGHYPAEAITETEVRGLSISQSDFRKALANSEGFRVFVLSTMAKRLRDVIVLVEDIAFQHLDIRLAEALQKLFKMNNSTSLKITHEELAMELGTTREVVSRLLKDFEQKKGCVRLHRGQIELVSPVCLSQCADRGFM
jgi:CRP/FNR family transcriptional regulator